MQPPTAAESERSFSTVFAYALEGHPCAVVGLDAEPRALPVDAWTRQADAGDHALLDHCDGPTLDIGCGPGRLTAALAEQGVVALGIDVVHEAVGQTLERGGSALQRDVFDTLPGEGRWHTALLADGNVGIGGDPVALLTRVHQLLDPRGRAVVEVEGPSVPRRTVWATLACRGSTSRPFRWAVVGVDDIDEVAAAAGFEVRETTHHEGRWFTVLDGAR
ncbi:MAG: methyltransferase domain-containing protein [Nocardioides sp.]